MKYIIVSYLILPLQECCSAANHINIDVGYTSGNTHQAQNNELQEQLFFVALGFLLLFFTSTTKLIVTITFNLFIIYLFCPITGNKLRIQ